MNDHRRRSPSGRLAPALAALALLTAAILAPTSFAAAPNPVLGSAVVDGDPGEWTAADYFADMTDNGDPDNETLATLSLRYDCDTGTVYALVMSLVEGKVKQDRPDQAYIRIDTLTVVRASDGDDGTPPDFAWVAGDGTRADGYEASFDLGPGSYTIRAHFLYEFDDVDGYLTVDTVPREAPLTIACPQPTPDITPTPTPVVTPTPLPTEDVNPTPTPVVTPTPTPVVTPTPLPTEDVNPTPTPVVTPSPTPTTSVAPTEGTPTPTPAGSVGGATGTPGVTLPPTDTLPSTGATDPASDGLRLVYLLLAALMATLALVTPVRTRRRAYRHARRR